MFRNISQIKLGILAVSRDCIVISLSDKCRAAVVSACAQTGIEMFAAKTRPRTHSWTQEVLAISTGFSAYNSKMLPPMVIGAVLGGVIGVARNKKMSESAVEKCFNILQIIVAGGAAVNIITSL